MSYKDFRNRLVDGECPLLKPQPMTEQEVALLVARTKAAESMERIYVQQEGRKPMVSDADFERMKKRMDLRAERRLKYLARRAERCR